MKSDGYSAHLRQIGAYAVVFEVVDSSGNATQYSVIVNVLDGIGPIVYIDASIVRVYNSEVLTLEDFTTLLVRAGELKAASEYRVTVRFDSYTRSRGRTRRLSSCAGNRGPGRLRHSQDVPDHGLRRYRGGRSRTRPGRGERHHPHRRYRDLDHRRRVRRAARRDQLYLVVQSEKTVSVLS
ncbi:MAG: hypothetical protein MZU97_14490 [Bacillus subtilis]|nr:hypothetical protein [Bacillus subtilis]